MARRLPVYLLVDTSGSMRGEPIQAVNMGIKTLMATLRQDPHALESVYLSIITFDNDAQEYMPLTALEDIAFQGISIDNCGATYTGAALHLLVKSIKRDVRVSTDSVKGDWRPLVFLMTDGAPSDPEEYKTGVMTLKSCNLSAIAACAAGPKAKVEHLTHLTRNIVGLNEMDESAFKAYFKWVSASVGVSAQSPHNVSSPSTDSEVMDSTSEAPISSFDLPPPPAEIQLQL
jgi:uncharacterized protein YegL